MFVGTIVSGKFSDSLNYADSDGPCDHSWLTMLSRNAPHDKYSLTSYNPLTFLSFTLYGIKSSKYSKIMNQVKEVNS